MRRDHIAAAAALLSIVGALGACDAKPRLESSPPAPVTEDESARTHRELREALSRRVDDIGRKLDELKEKAKTVAEDQRENLRKLSDELAIKKDEAAASLRELGDSAADKWEIAKVKTERAVIDLEKKVTEALK